MTETDARGSILSAEELAAIKSRSEQVEYEWFKATSDVRALLVHVEAREQQLAHTHDTCHDLVCNSTGRFPRGAKSVTCSCLGREQRRADEYDALTERLAQADAARLSAEQQRNQEQQRYDTLNTIHLSGRESVYVALGVQKYGGEASKAALQAVKGLQERVRFTETYESLQTTVAAQAERITHLETQRADAQRIVTDLRREYGQHDGLGMHCTCGQSWTLGMIQALEDALVASRSPTPNTCRCVPADSPIHIITVADCPLHGHLLRDPQPRRSPAQEKP